MSRNEERTAPKSDLPAARTAPKRDDVTVAKAERVYQRFPSIKFRRPELPSTFEIK